MKISVILDKYGFIESYASTGEVVGGTFIDVDLKKNNIDTVRVVDGVVTNVVKKELGVLRYTYLNPIFDGTEWIEDGGGSLDIENRYRFMVGVLKEIADDNLVGMVDNSEFLEAKEYVKSIHISNYKNIYINPPEIIKKYLKKY